MLNSSLNKDIGRPGEAWRTESCLEQTEDLCLVCFVCISRGKTACRNKIKEQNAK